MGQTRSRACASVYLREGEGEDLGSRDGTTTVAGMPQCLRHGAHGLWAHGGTGRCAIALWGGVEIKGSEWDMVREQKTQQVQFLYGA